MLSFSGVLWNLSSHDLLKEHLCREALPVLTSSVLVPCSGIAEGENPKDDLLADPLVFHNATGCLRYNSLLHHEIMTTMILAVNYQTSCCDLADLLFSMKVHTNSFWYK